MTFSLFISSVIIVVTVYQVLALRLLCFEKIEGGGVIIDPTHSFRSKKYQIANRVKCRQWGYIFQWPCIRKGYGGYVVDIFYIIFLLTVLWWSEILC